MSPTTTVDAHADCRQEQRGGQLRVGLAFRMDPSINGIEASETNAKARQLEFGKELRKR